MRILTFALVAPIAAFGSLAVGIRRPSWDRPGRSAVLGLVGACLGIDRDDDARQGALAQDYSVALLCHSPGRLLQDYHTAQAPRSRRGITLATRREELRVPVDDISTVVSQRDYRTGAWHLSAMWFRNESAQWSLDEIAAAMREPKFVTYLGRKSCPLGLPLAPEIVDAPDAPTALAERQQTGPEAQLLINGWRLRDVMADVETDPIITTDADEVPPARRHIRSEVRRDEPLSRRRWQHGLRNEAILAVGAR